eukprot:CAMPEP_0196589576 /NCGR_PEP_ID=MMETSP1081-20130531/63963_1 /TAXON_ID=36882 /ORGANISM="Pyramimonas amylifera, Strain CCMP720" /LENGTH=125 /DNA_ID=CAMNT_0041912421 /DNA_START=373 /DNA_END=750 /DNA_ORIENTATION=-
MVGTIDEYWTVPNSTNGETGKRSEMVAFATTVVKGNTLRGMWFYQLSQHSRSGIWFHTVAMAVDRGLRLKGVNYVDIGPSDENSEVANLKEKYGFTMSDTWGVDCDYEGPFRKLLEELELPNSNT